MNKMNFKNFVVIEYYFPKEGKFDDVMSISENSLKLFKNGIDGLLMAQILKPVSKDGPIGMLSIWKSKESLTNMMKNMDDTLKADVAKVQEWTSDIQVKMFEGVEGWHIN